MQARPISFAQHVAAAWREGVTMAAYAKTHGLAASTLYRWQQKLRQIQATATAIDAIDAIALTSSPAKPAVLEPTTPEPALAKFIALRIQSIEPRGSAQSAIAPQKHRHATQTMAAAMPMPMPTTATATTTRAAPIDTPVPPNCTLLLAGGIRLELPTLPQPQWLAALSHYAQADI